MAAGRRRGGKPDGPADGSISSSRDSAIPSVGRLLGIDWGEKRIGVALSDPTQTLAHPLTTLTRRRGRRFPMQQLRALLEEHQPVGVIVGLPLESDGSEGPAARAARELGSLIAAKSGLPVSYVDERMTTARVAQAVRELGGGGKGRRAEIDRLAATVLLQQHLDRSR